MNEAVPEQSAGGGADTAKLVVAILLVLAGIAAFYVLRAQPDWLRWLAVVAGVALAVVVFGTSAARQALLAVRARLARRAAQGGLADAAGDRHDDRSWCSLFVIVAGMFFWVLDVFLSWATRMLTGQGG